MGNKKKEMVRNITTVEELNQCLKDNKKVVVDFYADWCGPCRTAAPVFKSLSNEHTDVCFLKVNVDNASELSDKYGVSSIPYFVSFRDGQKVSNCTGFSQQKLKDMVSSL